jgi:hypothetical protein
MPHNINLQISVILTASLNQLIKLLLFIWEHAVTQLVEALCYKLEGWGFDSRWCQWDFSLT